MAAVWLAALLALSLQPAWCGKQVQLWLDCSCLHANERNASQWGRVTLNASQAVGAKNNCLMVFIGGMADELVAFRLEQLQLRAGDLDLASEPATDSCSAEINRIAQMLLSLEDLERRRRRASATRKASMTLQAQSTLPESEAMAVINEIFNPKLKLPESTGHYTLPEELSAHDLVSPQDLDIAKLAELKEVFLLFDTDCDGLISKDDLRFTYTALGNEPNEQLLEQMMQEAHEPLDYEAFVQLMCRRTQELDPEDVLLEAWSKWDDYGTGKIDERNCLDTVEIFPYLREPVIENSTQPAYTWCQHTSSARNATPIYSSGRLLGLRLSFRQAPTKADNWQLNLTASYRFLKQESFKTEGRLVPHSFCDFYFFASTNSADENLGQGYFHSPRFPAHYPAHIKCAYKFIGRPDSRVELLFEELQLPPVATGGCQLDALTIFDAESAHMDAVIDVLCSACPTRRIHSSGPDLLLEFNASSNRTAKGFRGKFKFVQPEMPPILEVASIALKQPPGIGNSLLEDEQPAKPARSSFGKSGAP
ncbi:CG33098 [Drosophila busckii]|uniref:CG33098 n=1 Tax=Drosophila busckii TaxID=30019 RepID=A0A0M4EDT9_DROBS|nr:CG33098 [Drosophila busckii]